MSTRHLLDEEYKAIFDGVSTTQLSLSNLANFRRFRLPLPPAQDCGVDWHERNIRGFDTPLTVRIYRPRQAVGPIGCIYHMHSGGFISGTIAEMEYLHRDLAAALGCAIITVDYRLAPETAFPGNIEDCYAGLEWTVAHASELDVDTARLGLMGESAGGGLAASLALLARDRGGPSLTFQHLIYPMLDDRTCVRKPHPHAGEFGWNAANNNFAWKCLLGSEPGGDDVSIYAAPARAIDLTGLPPTFISTAALDLFVDEDIEYARRLLHAGVPTELHVWPGAFHGFDMFVGRRLAQAARRASLDALRKSLGRDNPGG